MTDLIDIYEAAGGVANEERTQVTIDPSKRSPFKIELLVYPEQIETTNDGETPDMITFGVLLNEDFSFQEGTGMVFHHNYDVSIRMPVSQVKIIKED